jgi:hypothetical protein
MQEGVMRKRFLSALVLGIAVFLLSGEGRAAPAGPQNEPQPAPPSRQYGERGAAGQRTGGAITSVGVDRFELKGMNGETQTILVDDQTRFRQGQRESQKELGLEDLKPGDHVLVMGKLNDHKEFVASVVRRLTPEELARFQNAGDRAFGQIVSIQGNQLKIHNQYRGDQIVVVNDQTSIMKDGQAITWKDLKVGDRVAATGKEADGRLTADRIFSGQFQRGRGRMTRPPAGNELPPPPPQNP